MDRGGWQGGKSGRRGSPLANATVHRTVAPKAMALRALPLELVLSLCPLIPKQKHHPNGWCFCCGAGDEARTRYLDLGKVALYQMSYARKRKT